MTHNPSYADPVCAGKIAISACYTVRSMISFQSDGPECAKAPSLSSWDLQKALATGTKAIGCDRVGLKKIF